MNNILAYDCKTAQLLIKLGTLQTTVTLNPFINQSTSFQTTHFKNKIKAMDVSTYALQINKLYCSSIKATKVKMWNFAEADKVQFEDITSDSIVCNKLTVTDLECNSIKDFQSSSIVCNEATIQTFHCDDLKVCSADVSSIKTEEAKAQKVTCDELNARDADFGYLNAETVTADSIENFPVPIEGCVLSCYDDKVTWEKIQPLKLHFENNKLFVNGIVSNVKLPFQHQSSTNNCTTFKKQFQCDSIHCEDAEFKHAQGDIASTDLFVCDAANATIICDSAELDNLDCKVPIKPEFALRNGTLTVSLRSSKGGEFSASAQLPILNQHVIDDVTIIEGDVVAKNVKARYVNAETVDCDSVNKVFSKKAFCNECINVECNSIHADLDDDHIIRYQDRKPVRTPKIKSELNKDVLILCDGDATHSLKLPIAHQSYDELTQTTQFANTCIVEDLQCDEITCISAETNVLQVNSVDTVHADEAEFHAHELHMDDLFGLKVDKGGILSTGNFSVLEDAFFDPSNQGKLILRFSDFDEHMSFPMEHYTNVSDNYTHLKLTSQCNKLLCNDAHFDDLCSSHINTQHACIDELHADLAHFGTAHSDHSNDNIKNIEYEELYLNGLHVQAHLGKLNVTSSNISVDHTSPKYLYHMNDTYVWKEPIDVLEFTKDVLKINETEIKLPTTHQASYTGHTFFEKLVKCNEFHSSTLDSQNVTCELMKSDNIQTMDMKCETCDVQVLEAVKLETDHFTLNGMHWPSPAKGFLFQKDSKLEFGEFFIDPSITDVKLIGNRMVLSGNGRFHEITCPIQNITASDATSFEFDGEVCVEHVITNEVYCDELECDSLECQLDCNYFEGTIESSTIQCDEMQWNFIGGQAIPEPEEGILACIGGKLQWLKQEVLDSMRNSCDDEPNHADLL